VPRAPFSDNAVARVVSLAVELNEEKMFLVAFDLWTKKVNLETFESVGMALVRYRLDSLLPRYVSHTRLHSVSPLACYYKVSLTKCQD